MSNNPEITTITEIDEGKYERIQSERPTEVLLSTDKKGDLLADFAGRHCKLRIHSVYDSEAWSQLPAEIIGANLKTKLLCDLTLIWKFEKAKGNQQFDPKRVIGIALPDNAVTPLVALKRKELQDQTRSHARKILDDCGVSFEIAIPFLATLKPIEDIAGGVDAAEYLDAVGKFARNQVLATLPESQHVTLPQGGIKVVGTGANRHIDTGDVKMPQATGQKQKQEKLEADEQSKGATTVLGNPIPAELPAAEIPPDTAAKLEEIKAAAETPDNSDLTKLKSKPDFESDELGGKDSDVIQGEVIEERQSEWDAFDKPVMTDPAVEVARILKEAFPDTTPEYKLHFFREVMPYQKVAECVLAMGASDMYLTLKDAIAAAKANPVETIEQLKINIENATKEGQGEETPSADTSKSHSSIPVPESPTISKAVSVVPKADNALSIPAQTRSPLIPTRDECEFVFNYSRAVAASRFYKGVDTAEKAQVIMFKGLSIGIQAIDALDGFDVIDDPKRGISLFPRVKLLRGLVERTGKCKRFDIAGDDRKCTVTIQREGRNPNSYTFTIEDAAKMNLTKKYNWETMTARMLMYRACSLGINAEFPEINYSFGQAASVDDEDELDVA